MRKKNMMVYIKTGRPIKDIFNEEWGLIKKFLERKSAVHGRACTNL